MDLRDHRKVYTKFELLENAVNKDPFEQFRIWFAEHKEDTKEELNIMTLATATKDGKPSARIVLLKELNEDGFVFFTNYSSRKAKEIEENPHV
jgi:pyridoxamine 5'-phosphate oxidase